MNIRSARPALLGLLLFCSLSKTEKLLAQDVILQGFYWNTHPGDVTNTTTGGIWWDTLVTLAPQLGSSGAGFNAVWTPPATKGFAGVWDMGYGTYDYFDLGTYLGKGTTRTRHGSRAEMDGMLSALHANGMKVMADVVLNHRGGAESQAPYEFGGGNGYIVFDPPSHRVTTNASQAKYYHKNNLHNANNDFYTSFFFEDVCHFTDNDANPPRNSAGNAPSSWFFGTPPASPGIGGMGDSMIMWGRWLVNDVGFDELRLDAVKHVEPDFIAKWLVETKNGSQPFAVGELFDANTTVLRNYWDAVQNSGNDGGVKSAKISLFDFNLRDRLRDVLNATNGTEDIYHELVGAGLVWGTDMGGFDVVTWLDNHDTDRVGYVGDETGCAIPYGGTCLKLATADGHDPVVADKEDMGYPFILAAEGRPTVFWKDWFWYGLSKDIKWEMALRQSNATGGSDHIGNMAGDWNVAGYTVDNHGGNMFALRRNGLTGGVSDGMVLGLNDDDDLEHAVYVNTPFTDKYLKDYSDGYLFKTSKAFSDTRALIKAQKRDYSWWSVTGLYPKSPGTAASHFTINATPGGCPHFIAICAADASNLIVNGAPIAVGDEVAVKNAAGQVVGIGRIGQGFTWDGTHDMMIEALGSPSANGLAANEAFQVFVYDASASTTVLIGTVQYAANGTAFTFAPERGNSPNRNGNFPTFTVTTTATGTFSCEGISRILAFNTSVGNTEHFCAADEAANTQYNGGSWPNGSNGGNGLNAWALSTSGNAGFFTGSSTDNGNGDNNGDGDINTSSRAWCMYANGGGVASAVRPFVSDLVAGAVFTLEMDNGYIDNPNPNPNTVGFGLQNSSGNNLLEFYFTGGASFYVYNDLTNAHNTSIGFSDEGLRIQITLTSATAYSLVVTPLGGGSSSTYTGSLKNPAGGQSVNRLRMFNANAGNNTDHNACFNSISVCYPPTLVINEVDYDQPGGDTKEFIELKNVSGATVNLANYTLELVNGVGAVNYGTINLPNLNLAAGDYYVICQTGSNVANCDQTTSQDIQNGAPDAIRLRLNSTLTVDALSYEGSVTGAVEGSGTGLSDIDDPGTTALGISRIPDGHDTHSNNTDFVRTCITPGQANTGTTDSDSDGIPNTCDNCPGTANATQIDTDGDGIGDVCDPEINVTGLGMTIADGDIIPATADDTDFGTKNTGSSTTHTFTIQNTGTAALSIPAGGISLSGTGATQFSLSGITLPASIPAAGSTTFAVTYTPLSVTTHTAIVHIANDDANENPYDFAVKGIAIPSTTISGKIVFENNNAFGVQTVTVKLTGAATASTLTDVNGNYSMTVASIGNFTIKGVKNINRLNGVDMSDVTRIQQHITGNNPITSAYKLIAADINRNELVNTQDVSVLQQAILGNPAALAIFNVFWRFTDKALTLPVPPWSQLPAAEQINLYGALGNQSGKDFIGTKIGDVAAPPANPASGPAMINPLVWNVQDQILHAGESLTAAFRAAHFENLANYQFALGFDPARLQFSGWQAETAIPLDGDNFGLGNVGQGEIRTAWSQALGATMATGEHVFTLTFNVLQSGGKLSEVLWVDADSMPAVAYTPDFQPQEVVLEFIEAVTGINVPKVADGLQLLQNRPNPFSNETAVGFLMPAAGEARLRIFDTGGRLVAESVCDCMGGYHEEQFDLGSLAPGLLFCELTTPFGVRVKKMLRQ